MTGDEDSLWDVIDNAPKQNRKQRRAAQRNTDRSIRVGVFKAGGKHRRKTFKTTKPSTTLEDS